MRLESAVGDYRGDSRPAHVGVLVPWANMVVEEELPRLCTDGVVFHYARLVPPGRTTALDAGFLDGLRAALPEALASLGRLPLDGVLLACTSAGFTRSGGYAPGVVSAFDALIGVLDRLGAKRAALATPYPQAITELEAKAFISRGIKVTACASLDRDDGYALIITDEIMALVAGANPRALAEAQALVLSCTGWPTLGVIPHLEQDLAMPVVSSNLAMARYSAELFGRTAFGSGCA
jgi:maleate isomerase